MKTERIFYSQTGDYRCGIYFIGELARGQLVDPLDTCHLLYRLAGSLLYSLESQEELQPQRTAVKTNLYSFWPRKAGKSIFKAKWDSWGAYFIDYVRAFFIGLLSQG